MNSTDSSPVEAATKHSKKPCFETHYFNVPKALLPYIKVTSDNPIVFDLDLIDSSVYTATLLQHDSHYQIVIVEDYPSAKCVSVIWALIKCCDDVDKFIHQNDITFYALSVDGNIKYPSWVKLHAYLQKIKKSF